MFPTLHRLPDTFVGPYCNTVVVAMAWGLAWGPGGGLGGETSKLQALFWKGTRRDGLPCPAWAPVNRFVMEESETARMFLSASELCDSQAKDAIVGALWQPGQGHAP